MPHSQITTARVAAIVGPYLSGKTTLLESLLFATGTTSRKGSVKEGNLIGDSTPEARSRQMSVEVNVASFTYLDERWTVLDCPGSVELSGEAQTALMVADVAVVVAEPLADRAALLGPLFKFLDDNAIPHLLFINKIETLSESRISEVVAAFQAVSARKLVLREVPIRENGKVTGYVDLVSERAWHFNPHQPSNLISLPDTLKDQESEARQSLLEAVADFDDALLEKLLEDIRPDAQEVYDQMARELASDQIVPVLFGSAENDNGVRRLLKALRHEGPAAEEAAARLSLPDDAATLAQVFKAVNAAHAGRLCYARIWRGTVSDGMTLGGERVSGLYRLQGGEQAKLSTAAAGEIVALGRLEEAAAGHLLSEKGSLGKAALWPEPPVPLYARAIHTENRADEVKLTAAIQKLTDEDPSVAFVQKGDTGEMILAGQGDIHIDIAISKLRSKFNVAVVGQPPQVPYKETIRKAAEVHARFKRQSGGHGQFADIQVKVAPLGRGEGFVFKDAVVGGAIPRQYIPAVEAGIREWMGQGPLGFPVVDFEVTLLSGQFHAVDSSEMAFKTAARQAMQEAFVKCESVLLEPILQVSIVAPTEYTARVQRLVTGRRGQLLGFDARPGWDGWDEVKATMPQAETHDLIVELRSLSQGTGSYTTTFDHLQELAGKAAERVAELRQAALQAQG